MRGTFDFWGPGSRSIDNGIMNQSSFENKEERNGRLTD